MGFDNVNVNVSGPVQPTSTYKTKVLKGNHSFASQVTEPNMKYVIKHNFDLEDEEITIPENCVLEFDGGSIKNGTVVGQNTQIKAGLYKIFDNDVTLKGSWNVVEAYPEWFGAVGDGITDDSNAFITMFNLLDSVSSISTAWLSTKVYLVVDLLHIQGDINLVGFPGAVLYKPNSRNIIKFDGSNNVVRGITFRGGGEELDSSEFCIAKKEETSFLTIKDCVFEYATAGVFVNHSCSDIYISDCVFRHMTYNPDRLSLGYGIVLQHKDVSEDDNSWGTKRAILINNVFESSVYRHCFYIQSCEDVIIEGNIMNCEDSSKVTNYETPIMIRGSYNILLRNNTVIGGYGMLRCSSSYYHGYPSLITIQDNTIRDITQGKQATLSSISVTGNNLVIKGNTFKNACDCISVNYCNNISISGNYVTNDENAIDKSSFVYFGGHAQGTVIIQDNICLNDAGRAYIYLSSSNCILDTLVIKNNIFKSNYMRTTTIDGETYEPYKYSISLISGTISDTLIIEDNVCSGEIQIILSENEPSHIILDNAKIFKLVNNLASKFPNTTSLNNTDNVKMVKIEGNSTSTNPWVGRTRGNNNQRSPMTDYNEAGMPYFNTQLNKPIWWKGSAWVEGDGATAGIKRSGTTSQRPANDNIYIGFMYTDTTIGKPIYWNGTAWIDATGATV